VCVCVLRRSLLRYALSAFLLNENRSACSARCQPFTSPLLHAPGKQHTHRKSAQRSERDVPTHVRSVANARIALLLAQDTQQRKSSRSHATITSSRQGQFCVCPRVPHLSACAVGYSLTWCGFCALCGVANCGSAGAMRADTLLALKIDTNCAQAVDPAFPVATRSLIHSRKLVRTQRSSWLLFLCIRITALLSSPRSVNTFPPPLLLHSCMLRLLLSEMRSAKTTVILISCSRATHLT
jgi:hypothetical protein